MPVVATRATAVTTVVMAATPSTTGASAPAVIMVIFVLGFVSPVLAVRKLYRAAAPSSTGVYSYNPWIMAAIVFAASMIPVFRWYRRQASSMASCMASCMASSMFRPGHSLHVLHSLNFVHSLPKVRWNLLALQYDFVQLASFECPSPVPLIIVLQLTCIQVLSVPEFLLVKTQLSLSFPPVPFLDLVLSPSTAIVWNHGPIITSAASVHVVCDVPAILGKGKTFDARFVGRAGAPFLYF